MAKYRKKPVEVDAIKWENTDEGEKQIKEFTGKWPEVRNTCLLVYTMEGVMKAQPGDWIIKGVEGEFYPCKPSVFEKTYETAE